MVICTKSNDFWLYVWWEIPQSINWFKCIYHTYKLMSNVGRIVGNQKWKKKLINYNNSFAQSIDWLIDQSEFDEIKSIFFFEGEVTRGRQKLTFYLLHIYDYIAIIDYHPRKRRRKRKKLIVFNSNLVFLLSLSLSLT